MSVQKRKTFYSGDRVLKSKMGARGFFYPDPGESLLVRKSCEAEIQIGWNKCGNYVPYVVPSDVFSDKDRYSKEHSKVVVWAAVKT